jgi:hypothetical protein
MNVKRFFVFGLPAVLLALALVLWGCPTNTDDGGGGTNPPADDDNDTNLPADPDGDDDTPFTAVTGITDVATAAIVGRGLPLSATVEPSNATNKTIVWSGIGVSNGVLTATSAGTYRVTAAIANGKSESSSYTQSFNITAYTVGAVGPGENPFVGTWTMDNKGGTVYVTLTNTTWTAAADGAVYNSGTYTHITGTKAAEWTVTGGGHYTGNTGIAFFTDDDTIRVANFSNVYSEMNGTFTKLNPSLTLRGTWISTTMPPELGGYARITADGSGNVTFAVGVDSGSLTDLVRGTYTPTNPVVCAITHVNSEAGWVPWNTLDAAAKEELSGALGGSTTSTGFIYSDRFEMNGVAFYKQP